MIETKTMAKEVPRIMLGALLWWDLLEIKERPLMVSGDISISAL